MHFAEVLSQLRALNWLSQEARSLPADSAQHVLLESQAGAMHDRLPTAISAHHDRIARSGRTSLAAAADAVCGSCHTRLPSQIVEELREPGRFAVCPRCQVFVCSATDMETELNSLLAGRKALRR